MTKRKLNPAQKNLLGWVIAWSVVLILILTCGEFAYLSIIQATWWGTRVLFGVLLVEELALYILWGMISAGRIAPRTILVFVCKPIRHLAYQVLRLTMPYAAPEEEAFTLFACILPAQSERK